MDKLSIIHAIVTVDSPVTDVNMVGSHCVLKRLFQAQILQACIELNLYYFEDLQLLVTFVSFQ